MRIVGYADAWSVENGATIRFMVSSELPHYQADLVRLLHPDASPAGPGLKAAAVQSSISGQYPGRVQKLPIGSYVRVPAVPIEAGDELLIEAWIMPTLPRKGRQAIIGQRGAFELALEGGCPEFRVGSSIVRLDKALVQDTWYAVRAVADFVSGELRVAAQPVRPTAWRLGGEADGQLHEPALQPCNADILIASSAEGEEACHFYNGKIDAPRIAADGRIVAHWDFAADVSSRRVRDISGNALDGRAVNMPTRAVTGHNFTSREVDWRHAPGEYGAIHFHDDDLDDAGWEPAFEWTVPDAMPSGVYAVHLRAGRDEDHVPFFVRPKCGSPRSKILFLAPLFSYMAYGNGGGSRVEREEPAERQEKLDALWAGALNRSAPTTGAPPSPADHYIRSNVLLSVYDTHSDGSAVFYSSRLRPLVNMRPRYVLETPSGRRRPHQLVADLFIIDWLHQMGYEHDIVTDEDLHIEGSDLLAPYQVVVTGAHPEYVSTEILDAISHFLEAGGKLMYLGGNGFYFVTQLDPEEQHTIEVRRLLPIPAVEMPLHAPADGERHFSTSGELGGLWQERGRSPHRLVGVGMDSGTVGRGAPYARRGAGRDPAFAFIFEGVRDDELIGDFPCLVQGHGAAGDEVDSVDHRQGSPRETTILASASGFPDGPAFFPPLYSPLREFMRADMAYLDYPNGGAVFSASSMAWCGSLSYNGYDNNVSRITRNVLDRFSGQTPKLRPQ